MIDQLKQIDSIYDLMALCGAYILCELKKKTYEFALFEDDDYDCVYDAIERYCCEVQEKGRRIAFEELKDYILSYMTSEVTIEKCFAVVKYIDELVEIEIQGKLLGARHIIKYCALNEQYTDNIRIIPKMKRTFLERGNLQFKSIYNSQYSLFRDRRECACSILDEEMLNYMVWDHEHINKYPMWIYRFDEKSIVFKHFYERKEIIFGIVPFTSRPLKEILDIKYEDKVFYVEQMNEEAENDLRERYREICNKCEQEDIDFLIIPEMLMTGTIISAIRNKEKVSSPQFIINGSIWKDFMNKSIITDGRGEEIFSYNKKEPYRAKKGGIEYKEYLEQDKNREYSIMEIDGVGRIGVGICKDILNEDVKLFHKYVGTDILIVPACTKSMDLLAAAEGMSKEYNCVVAVANTCAALHDSDKEDTRKRIGFITLPAKCDTDRAQITVNYYQDGCMKECSNRCIGKKFIIDFYNIKEYKEGISYEVKEMTF